MVAIKSKSIDEISAMADQRLPVPGADVAWLVKRARELKGALQSCMRHIDTPTGHRRLRLDSDCKLLLEARALLKADQEDRSGMSNHTYEIRRYSPNSLSFYFGEAGYVGSLFVEERSLHFEGDVDKSAQTFLAGVRKLLEQEGEQEKRDREIRNKAIDDACNTINRLSADGEMEGCSSDFILSFASDLVQSLKEGPKCP